MKVGTPEFSIRCELGDDKRIGFICVELGDEVLGSFDQPCLIEPIARDLDVALNDAESRRDLLLASLDPAEALERVYSASFGSEATEADTFWHQRFVWLQGYEPFDAYRSILLSKPEGFLIVWDENDSKPRQVLVSEELYRRAVYDLLAWLELSGAGSHARPACGACAFGRLSQRELAYDKALKRMGAHLNRERKLSRKAQPSP